MTPEEKKRAATAALNDPAISAILDALQQDAIDTWCATALADAEKREISYFQQLGVTQIRQQLLNWSNMTTSRDT